MSANIQLDKLRNVGIIAHIDAGKTTTTERILFCTGIVSKIGEVHDGEAVTDWMEQEKERGITITSATTKCKWKVNETDYDVNIIDTPGHVDFTIEVERSLRVLDGAVCVLDGVAGVQTQTMTVWKQANKHKVPRIIFVNKLDRDGADFFYVVKTINNKLSINKDQTNHKEIAVIVNIPVEQDGQLVGIIDLVKMVFYYYPDQKSMEYEIKEIPSDYVEKANEYRAKLIDTVIDQKEELMEKYLDDASKIENHELISCIKAGTLNNSFVPVLAGSAYKNLGVQMLLDAMVNYLPSPLEVRSIVGTNIEGTEEKKVDPAIDKPFCGLAFKLMNDPFVGNLTFVRVYSGVLDAGSKVYLPRTKKNIKIGRMVQMHANNRQEIKQIRAGDIVAVIGGDLVTGDTICDEKEVVILENITPPEAVIAMAIEPKTREDKEKLAQALPKLQREDPSFRFEVDKESKQNIIKGMGELHLEIIVDRLKREFKVDVKIGDPIVSYKETITKEIDITQTLKKQSGGAGQFAVISMKIRPLESGKGFNFLNKIVGGAIPQEYIPGIIKGVQTAAEAGSLLGYPIIDYEVEVYDGRIHEVDSSILAFEICARGAIRENIAQAGLILLEPIMTVDISVPEEYLGTIMGDINSKRGIIIESSSGRDAKILAQVPLAEMTGYIKALREKTKGTGTFSMEFEKYATVPNHIVDMLKQK